MKGSVYKQRTNGHIAGYTPILPVTGDALSYVCDPDTTVGVKHKKTGHLQEAPRLIRFVPREGKGPDYTRSRTAAAPNPPAAQIPRSA